MLSVFLRDPQFQGQTKDKLVSMEAQRWTETAIRDRFELWLSAEPDRANWLLEQAIERMEDRKTQTQRKRSGAENRNTKIAFAR